MFMYRFITEGSLSLACNTSHKVWTVYRSQNTRGLRCDATRYQKSISIFNLLHQAGFYGTKVYHRWALGLLGTNCANLLQMTLFHINGWGIQLLKHVASLLFLYEFTHDFHSGDNANCNGYWESKITVILVMIYMCCLSMVWNCFANKNDVKPQQNNTQRTMGPWCLSWETLLEAIDISQVMANSFWGSRVHYAGHQPGHHTFIVL